MGVEYLYRDLTYIGCCYDLSGDSGHKEVVYQRGLVEKLKAADIPFEREIHIPVLVNGKKVGTYVPDFVIDSKVLVEIKAKRVHTKQDIKQFWHYLKSTHYKLGLLINFGEPDGVKIVRQVYDSARKDLRYQRSAAAKDD